MINIYYPLLKNANNEMKALKNLKESSIQHVTPIIESKRIKVDNIANWESTFRTLGSYLKERVQSRFIYDFNCAFEDLGDFSELTDTKGENLVEHCIKKMTDAGLNFVPCFHHDSPNWIINSVLNAGFSEIAVRIRCHDFQESLNEFIIQKLQRDLSDHNINVILILDFFNKTTSINVIESTIRNFEAINHSELVYLATSCPDNASEAIPNEITTVEPRRDFTSYIELKRKIPHLEFGDYTTRLKGEVLKGFNHNNSYIKIFYSTEESYLIAKSELIKNDGDTTFHRVCEELIDQDFYPGPDFSFGDSEIHKCAYEILLISDHQAPIAIGVNHHIELTINQLNSSLQESRDLSVS